MQTKVIINPTDTSLADIIRSIEAIISRYIYLDIRDTMMYNEATYYHWLSDRE